MNHANRAWRLIRAKVTDDKRAEQELNREVGERTEAWYGLAHTLADIIADELAVQISEARWYQIKTEKYGVDDDVIAWLRDRCAS